jgi:peptidoglycan/LPS O-acetylase OafA/YrhL
MATNNIATRLGTGHLMAAVVSFLGWMAVAALAFFQQLPKTWPQQPAFVKDIGFGTILLCGPAFLAAGSGLRKRRPWARFIALGLGAVAAALAITGFALICCGVLEFNGDDLALLALFASYSILVFVVLWHDPFLANRNSIP